MSPEPDLPENLAVRVQNVTKTYELGELLSLKRTLGRFTGRSPAVSDPFEALHDVSFEVERGECVSMLGGNGSGKSTVLQIIAGLTLPTSGHAAVRGRVLPLFEIGNSFHPDLTGRENVVLFGTILGLPRRDIHAAMDEIAAFAEVERHIDTPVKRYSLGMIARLSFAISMRFPADVYIFDEVLAVVDDEFTRKCLREMRGLAAAGRCVLFVSHDINAVKAVSSRGIWLEKGHLRAIGDVEDVAAQYAAAHADPEPTAVEA